MLAWLASVRQYAESFAQLTVLASEVCACRLIFSTPTTKHHIQ